MTDNQNLKVGSDDAIEVVAPDPVQATVTNLGPNSVYYDDSPLVSSVSNDGTLTQGSSLTFNASKHFISAGRSRLHVNVPDRLSWLEDRVGALPVDVRSYGAVGDGVADDTAALQAALDAGAGRTVYLRGTSAFYKVTDDLVVPADTHVRGDWGGGFWAPAKTIIKKTNGDTNANRIFYMPNGNCRVSDIAFEGPTTVDFYASTYPAGTSNPSYALYGAIPGSGWEGTRVERCRFRNFKAAAIGGQWSVPVVGSCVFAVNLYGIDWDAYDGAVQNSFFLHNVHTGFRTAQNYNRFINNRVEWNKRYGAVFGTSAGVGGASAQVTANTFDRNGWSGLVLYGWHTSVVGNHFRRNGGGGNGTLGLTAAHTTSATDSHGNVMYLAPATENDKAHLQVDYAKYSTITGNTFDHYGDDANGGADSPKYVYAFKTLDNMRLSGNEDAVGWNTAYPGGTPARTYTDSNVVTPWELGDLWHVDVDVFTTPASQDGFGTLTVDANTLGNGWLQSNTSPAAYIEWDVMLGSGTWTVSLLHTKGPNRPIYTVKLDGTSVGTIDGYAAASTYNVLSTITGVAVVGGKKRLRIEVPTKNASSSDYVATIQKLTLRRTA